MGRKLGNVVVPVLLQGLAALVALGGCAGQARTTGSSSFDEGSYLFFREETHAKLVSAFVSFETLMNDPLGSAGWEESLKFSMASI